MKTLKHFLEQGEPQKEDPKVNQAEKKENMLKKRVLQAKMRAVRGGATGIMASHEPEGEVIEGVMTMIGKKKPAKKAEKAMDAGARAKRKLARKVHAKYVSGSEDNVPDDIREADSLAAQTARWEANRQRRMKKSGSYERPNWIPRDQDHSDRYGSSKGEKKKPQKTHANLQNEAKVDTGTPEEKEKARNVRKFGVSHNVSGHGKLRRALHRSNRGDKKIKGDKSAYVEMEGYKGTADLSKADPAAKKKVEDRIAKHVGTKRVPGGKMGVKEEKDAFAYVVAKLKKQHGDGVLTKRDKIKPQSPAEKAKVRAHQAKVDKENAAERAKDPSQGRYPKG